MKIMTANESHYLYASIICDTMAESAKARGTGIAKRTPELIIEKMKEGNAIIALDGQSFAGFCYIETWDHEKFVANSGLIVSPEYRGMGMARKIKDKIFELSREKYPEAKIFSITTGLAVMRMNSDLGYKPVTFSELPQERSFWKGCQSCPNYDVLQRTKYKMCLCTGMVYNPEENKAKSLSLNVYSQRQNNRKIAYQEPKVKVI